MDPPGESVLSVAAPEAPIPSVLCVVQSVNQTGRSRPKRSFSAPCIERSHLFLRYAALICNNRSFSSNEPPTWHHILPNHAEPGRRQKQGVTQRCPPLFRAAKISSASGSSSTPAA